MTRGRATPHEAPYFAYGSNMDPGRMAERCPDATPVGCATLADHRVVIGHRGVATVTPEPGTVTWGVLWAVSEQDVKALDRAEGVRLGLYRKETHTVVEGDTPIPALVYVEPFSAAGTPRDGYLDHLLRGAAHFGLPAEYRVSLERLADPDAPS